MSLLYKEKLENFLNDFDLFKNGAINSDITLSDLTVLPSYRKFVINEIDRAGKSWNSTKTYLIDDLITINEKLFVAKTNNLNKNPETSSLDWKEIKKEGTSAGYGLRGYITFETTGPEIIDSKNIVSLTKNSYTEYTIIVNDIIRAGANNKMCYAFSYSSLDLATADIVVVSTEPDSSFRYFLYGRTAENIDNTLKIVISADKAKFNPIIHIVFL